MSSKKSQQLKHNDLADWIEAKIEELKPYTSQIVLGSILVLLAVIGAGYWLSNLGKSRQEEWKDFEIAAMQANSSSNTKELVTVAERFSDSPAGLWALQRAADYELNAATRRLFQDRAAGKTGIAAAKAKYQQVVENAKSKDAELLRRAHFGLAKACESLGEWDEAIKNYKTLVEDAGNTPIGEVAVNALARVQSPDNQAFYEEFITRSPATGSFPGTGMSPQLDAPGMQGLPTTPDISLPDTSSSGLNLPSTGVDVNQGGGSIPLSTESETELTPAKDTEPGAGDQQGSNDFKPPVTSNPGSTTEPDATPSKAETDKTSASEADAGSKEGDTISEEDEEASDSGDATDPNADADKTKE